MSPPRVRSAAVAGAGAFYPDDPLALRAATAERLLARTRPPQRRRRPMRHFGRISRRLAWHRA